MKKMTKKNKIFLFLFASLLLIGLITVIPSLATVKNKNIIFDENEWDGSVATSYQKGDGSLENPFIISDGSEFAFFIEQLKTTDYAGLYFELGNDIIINEGVFEYIDGEVLKYTINGSTYYVEEYSKNYYDNEQKEGISIGSLNSVSMIETFKGNLDGKSFTIYGMYITSGESDSLGLIKNLEGKISNLNFVNSVVYGKGNVAGIAVNATNTILKNIIYDGYVINKEENKINEFNIEEVIFESGLLESSHSILLPELAVDGLIKSTKLVGEYTTSDEEIKSYIKMNSIDLLDKKFEMQLGNNLLKEVPIVLKSDSDNINITFSNLKYVVEYCDDITAGIISKATNTKLKNVVNKSNIYGNYISSGFVGKGIESLEIVQSYNKGNIKGINITAGFLGEVKSNANIISITNVYNTGSISSLNTGSLVGVISENTGEINITNSINATSNYAINSINNSSVNIFNSYSIFENFIYSGQTNGQFVQTLISDLYDEENMIKNSYNKFVGVEDVEINESNVWIYENDSLPILYIDKLETPIATLNANTYSWNEFTTELNLLSVNNNITFSIEEQTIINPVKEKYYYIHKSTEAITEEKLIQLDSWNVYNSVITIEESGYYIIYAKIIDSHNNITYINSDIMVLNVSGFKKNINVDNNTWDSFKTNLNEIYTNKEITATITAHNDLVEMKSIEYYISDTELTEENVIAITTWSLYSDYITINTPGKYVIYAKIVDSDLNTTYINTDYINYSGFKETLSLGNSDINYNTNYITNNSSIKLVFENEFEFKYSEGYSHNLITNVLLPLKTELTLIDKNSNKIYKKIIDTEEDLYGYSSSCDGISNCSNYATYSFDLFKELGVLDSIYYNETDNYNKTISNEKYIIIIDFKNATMIENYYGVSFNLMVKSQDGQIMYNTLNNSTSIVSIYSVLNESLIVTTHSINNDYANQIINYNSNSETNINFSNELIYSSINEKEIIDTEYENKKSGLEIKMYDDKGSLINKKYLDNMIFEINGVEYFASSDNSIKIDLGSVTSKELKTLKIKTKENSSNLKIGTYYLKINGYISDNGYYFDSLYDKQVIIPIVVSNQSIEATNYSFDVQMTSQSIILDNDLENSLVTFNIVYSGSLIAPNVRLSLYKKDKLTAYNQDYTKINLKEYTNDVLTFVENDKCSINIDIPTFSINLLTNKLENNGYKYVFELYDGENKVSEISKYFIAK